MTNLTKNRMMIRLRQPHAEQARFINSTAKRKIIRAGRRSGKTVGVSILAVKHFLVGRRVLYAAPTNEQLDRFWQEVTRALREPIEAGYLYKNESLKIIEVLGTEQRIRAKTAWNADTLRGDYADLLILDEWQLMDEEAWEVIGAPMLLDNNGDVVFVYTPPSLRSRSASKARDPRHASKMFKMASADHRWAAFHFASSSNPHISQEALKELALDMTSLSYRQEILGEDVDEVPGALWNPRQLEECRTQPPTQFERIVIAVDPSVTAGGSSDETGIVVCGKQGDKAYVLRDLSGRVSPNTWTRLVVSAYYEYKADRIVVETNNGGDLVEITLRTVDRHIPITKVHASRGKMVRAEPVAALYEQGKVLHCGRFPELEDQMCSYTGEGERSPDRLDALVYAITELMLKPQVSWGIVQ
jgi:predicted phage terminase large subunit-like protein